MNNKVLTRFLLRVMLLLPLTFLLWYVSARWHLAPITLLSQAIIKVLAPDALLWLKLDGHNLIIAANFTRTTEGIIVSPAVGQELLGFQLNPLIYSYSLPLLTALLLATPAANPFKHLVQGLLLLVPTEIISMVFSVLKTLAFDIGLAFQMQQGLAPSILDGIAIGYQLSTLLLPMVTPLIIWAVLKRDFLECLAPNLTQALTQS